MTITMLKAKIHRATVTQAELDYVGSITVDMDLLEQAGILEYDRTAFSICSFLEFANAKRPTASTLWSSKISCSSDMILDEGERFLANSREAGSVSQIYAMSHRPLFCISSQYICPILPNPIKPTFIFMVGEY